MNVIESNKLVFALVVLIFLLGVYDISPRQKEARICPDREGIQIAFYVPGGKRRWSKMVILYGSDQIPYGLWMRCRIVELPKP